LGGTVQQLDKKLEISNKHQISDILDQSMLLNDGSIFGFVSKADEFYRCLAVCAYRFFKIGFFQQANKFYIQK
jgi:hypothetical protein